MSCSYLNHVIPPLTWTSALFQAASLEKWTSYKELALRCLRAEKLRSIRFHIVSLMISALSYLISLIILSTSHGSDKATQVIKIILWYSPILFEATMSFLAMTQPGHVFYPMDRVFERSAAIFVIILGGGEFRYGFWEHSARIPSLTTVSKDSTRLPKGFSS